MAETWRPVVGFEGLYEVSDLGNVRGVDRVLSHGRRRKGSPICLKKAKRGHISVRLCNSGTHYWRWVHRLVLEAFAGPCPDGWEGCHNNGKASDNRLGNLRWDTKENNEADKILHGTIMRGSANGMSRLDETSVSLIRNLHSCGVTGREIASRFGVTPANISSIIKHKTWSHVQ